MRLDLLQRIQCDTHDNQQPGTAEETLKAGIHPQIVDDKERENRNAGQKDGTGKRDMGQDAVNIIRRAFPRPHPGDKPSVLLHIVRQVNRIEDDGGIKIGEKDNHQAVKDPVGKRLE